MNEVQILDEATEQGETDDDPATIAPVVSAIVGTAVSAASKRAGRADVAHGLIAGLRLLRSAAEEEAGYGMGVAIDTAIRTRLLVENLSALRATGREPAPVPLPSPGEGLAIASVIVTSAAESCLMVNAHAPDNEPLELAVFTLSTYLVQHLGGAPDWRSLSLELHRPSSASGAAEAAALPAGGGTMH